MSFDISRSSFDPRKDYLGVVMQQGRVQLDSDWNEWQAELGRRLQAGTLDAIGSAGVPQGTPDGFRITVDNAGSFSIGPGRIYVDGLLAENHGAPERAEPPPPPSGVWEWNPSLAEERGLTPVPFLHQPYLPFNHPPVALPAPGAANAGNHPSLFNPPGLPWNRQDPALPGNGRDLIYLDVWQRPVTPLQDPALVEKAVGVDTTGRLQTVWQVKLLAGIGPADCGTADDQVPGWPETIRPSGGRLTTSTGAVQGPANPCLAPPGGGYKGSDNQLYRVEIHRGGGLNEATFKWSRDNGTVATRVLEIHGSNRLVVESTGRDDEFLGFRAGDWIEVLDDWHELHGQPGQLRRIRPADGVDKETRTIALEDPLPNGLFPVDGQGRTLPERHTRIRRWDQSGKVLSTDGLVFQEFHDLDTSAASAGIPVAGGNPPASPVLVLEAGIQVQLTLAGNGVFHTGDHWLIAARSADGSIEQLIDAPPLGIHHHYARLAVVERVNGQWVGPASDCRTLFPPLTDLTPGCCTVVVEPGTDMIQAAIDSLPPQGGCVCLRAGIHEITRTVVIRRNGVTLHGESSGAVVRTSSIVPLLQMSGRGNRIEGIAFRLELIPGTGVGGDPAFPTLVNLDDVVDVSLIRCQVSASQPLELAGVRIGRATRPLIESCRIENGYVALWFDTDSTDLEIRHCDLVCRRGDGSDLGLIGVWIEDAYGPCFVENNHIEGYNLGIRVDRADFGQSPSRCGSNSRIAWNWIIRQGFDEELFAVLRSDAAFGIDVSGDRCQISENRVVCPSPSHGGIRITGQLCSVTDNHLTGPTNLVEALPRGVLIGAAYERFARFGERCLVAWNRFAGDFDAAISVIGADDVDVRANWISATSNRAGTGISLERSRRCRVEGNRIEQVQLAIETNEGSGTLLSDNELKNAGLGISATRETSLWVRGNQIENLTNIGLIAQEVRTDIRISGNRFLSCAYQPQNVITAAIWVGDVLDDSVFNLILEENEILDTGISIDGDTIVQSRSDSVYVVARHSVIRGNRIAYRNPLLLATGASHRSLTLFAPLALNYYTQDRLATTESALVEGNTFIGPSSGSLVWVRGSWFVPNLEERFYRVTFASNLCRHLAVVQGGPQPGFSAYNRIATVFLEASRSTVQANQVASFPVIPSFDFNRVGRTVFVGNFTDGPVINWTAFPVNFAALNRFG